MNTADALRKIMNVSGVIENRIDELMSSSVQEEFTLSNSVIKLYNEALAMLIGLLKENGIEFHCDDDQLFGNTYNTDFFIALYQYFIPSRIKKYFDVTYRLYDNALAYTANISDDEFISKLLEANRDTTRAQFDKDLYNFFYDKIISTPEYVFAITSIFNDIAHGIVNIPNEITQNEIDFLSKITTEKRLINLTITDLIHKGGLPIDYQSVSTCCSQFGKEYSIYENLFVFSKYEEYVVSNNQIITKMLNNIHKHSVFYIDHYSNEEISTLSIDMVVCILLHQVAELHLFNIPVNFTRLIKYAHKDIPIKNIINMIPSH